MLPAVACGVVRLRTHSSVTPAAGATRATAPKIPSHAANGKPSRWKYPHRLKPPASHAAAVVTAATHQERRNANHSTGSGANHISGHQGSSASPNPSSTPVSADTRFTVPLLFRLFANSIHIPP